MGFTDIYSHFSSFGGIDITPYFEFTCVMDPPLAYHIVEIHDSSMIGVTTRNGQHDNRAPLAPCRDARIQQTLPQT